MDAIFQPHVVSVLIVIAFIVLAVLVFVQLNRWQQKVWRDEAGDSQKRGFEVVRPADADVVDDEPEGRTEG